MWEIGRLTIGDGEIGRLMIGNVGNREAYDRGCGI